MFARIKELFRKPLVLAVSAFAFFFVLASFFAFDPGAAFWSNFERGEGGLQMLHLYVYFILLLALFRKVGDWRSLFFLALVGGILSGLYGVFAGFGTPGFIGPLFHDAGYRFQASIGNPAYVATYALFLIFFTFCLFFTSLKPWRSFSRLLSLSFILPFLLMFYFAATRGAFVGLIGMVLVFLVYVMLSRRALRRWFFAAALLVIVLVGLGVQFRDAEFIQSLPGSRIFDLSLSAQTFQHRTIMWRIAWEGFKVRPLLGWGPENYIHVFDRHFDVSYFKPDQGFGSWFDRAHSVYFDYLVETGILGLLSFLAVFIFFYLEFFKKTGEGITSKLGGLSLSRVGFRGLLFAFPAAYLIQGIVLFDVFIIYLNIFIILAFASFLFYFSERQLL